MHRSRETRSHARMETCEGPARRGLKRSRGTGPRATVSRTVAFFVCSLRSPERKWPRAALGTPPFTVGRGPVPRHATIARDRPSPYGGLGGFRLDRCLAGDRPPRYGDERSWGKPARMRVWHPRAPRDGDREIAGDRPPRYGYFVFFTSPNVVSIRFAAETRPGNSRVTNVSRFPSNATSSI